MKIKNIAFSGFAAAIFAASAANAAVTQIASKEYVDNAKTDTLQQVSGAYVSKTDLDSSITSVLDDDKSALAQKLADKQDALSEAELQVLGSGITSEKLNTITTDITTLQGDLADKADKVEVAEGQDGNVAYVDSNGQYQVGDVKANTLVTDGNIAAKIAGALENETVSTKISNAVGTAIATSITSGELNTALEAKANADAVYTKSEVESMIDLTLPMPSAECQANSGHCVLSVVKGSKGKTGLAWVPVTEPFDEGTSQGE